MKRRNVQTSKRPNRPGSILGRAFDWAIEPFAPTWARRRSASRLQNQALRALNHDGAARDRTLASWRARFQSKDAEMATDLPTLIARSRDVRRNTAPGRAVVNSYGRNVVGVGIRPSADAVDADGNSIEEFNRRVEEDFFHWANNAQLCDVERRLTFWQIQKQVMEQLAESGEMFVHRAMSNPPGSPSSLCLQRFEVDSLNTMVSESNGHEVRRGVEIDAVGAPIAYHFFKRPLNDIGGKFNAAGIRIPAERMNQIFEQERPGQTHGVPILSVVLRTIRDLAEFIGWELYAAKVLACITMVVNQKDPDEIATGGLATPTGDDGKDLGGNTESLFEPGMIFRGESGEDINAQVPSRPGGAFIPFVQTLLRQIGAAVGLSYGQVSRDHSEGNYSSQKQERGDDQATFTMWQQLLASGLCQSVWNDFVTYGVLAGRYDAPDFFENPQRYLRAAWTGPGIPWTDPHREIKAAGEGLKSGVHNLRELSARQGRNWEDDLIQRKREQDFAEKIGLTGGGESASDEDDELLDEDEDKRDPDALKRRNVKKSKSRNGSAPLRSRLGKDGCGSEKRTLRPIRNLQSAIGMGVQR